MNEFIASGLEQVPVTILFWLIHLGWIGLVIGIVGWIGDRILLKSSVKLAYRWNMFCFFFLIVGSLAALALSAATVPQVATGERPDFAVDIQEKTQHTKALPVLGGAYWEQAPLADHRHLNSPAPKEAAAAVGVTIGQDSGENRIDSFQLIHSPIFESAAVVISAIYFFGCCIMLVRLAMAGWGCRRLSRGGKPVTEEGMLDIAQRTARQLGLKVTPALSTCERIIVPVVMGLVRPVVLLPVSIIGELTPDQLRAILAHEMAHLKRYDHWVVVFQRVAEAILFFHPTTWQLSRRLDSQRELCCDDLVLQTGTSPLEYARTLYLIAGTRKNASQRIKTKQELVALAADGANASQTLIRISRMLDETLPSPKIASSSFWAANIVIGALLVGMPCLLLFGILNNQIPNSSAAIVETSSNVQQSNYGTFRGVIRNENGELVGDATVVLQEHPYKYLSPNAVLPPDPERAAIPPIIFDKSKTEMDGEFEISNVEVPDFQQYLDSPYPITMLIIHEDYALTWQHLKSPSSQKIEYRLKKGTPISFGVVSNTGKPLENVTAKLCGTMTRHDWNNVHPYRRIPAELIHQGIAINPAIDQQASGLLSSKGESGLHSWQTNKVNSEMVAVFEVGAKGHVKEKFYVTNIDIASNPDELAKNDFADVLPNGSDIRLRQAVNVKLKFADQNGRPVKGVEIEADTFVQTKPRTKPKVTPSDVPGELNVVVNTTSDGKPFKLHLLAMPTKGAFLNSEQLLEIDPAESNQTFKIELATGSPLNGKVVDAETGIGIPNVTVRFRENGKKSKAPEAVNGPFQWPSFGKSNANGEFVLYVPVDDDGQLPEGILSAKDAVDGYQTWVKVENTMRPAITRVDPTGVDDLILKLPSVTSAKNIDSFQVKVLDENGEPAARAKVRFYCTYTSGSTGMPDTQRTDQNGLLILKNNGPLFNFRNIAIVALSEDEKSAATAVYVRPENIKTNEELVRYMNQMREGKSPDDPSVVLTANLKPMARVRGQAIDANTNQPIPFAKVRTTQYYLEEIDIMKSSFHLGNFFPYVEADKDGFFELKAVANLRCKVEAVHKDYLERKLFTDDDYFTPNVGQTVEKSVWLVAKEVNPIVTPNLGDRQGAEALDFLKLEFDAAQKEFRQAISKGDAVDSELVGKNSPATVYLPEVLRISDGLQGEAAALNALVWACNISINSCENQELRYELRAEIGNRLMRDHIESPKIVDCLEHLIYSQPDAKLASDKILNANKDKAVQGNVLLLMGRSAVSELGLRAKGYKHTKWFKKMTDNEIESYAHKTFTRIKEEFGDVPYWRHGNLGTIARMQLFEFDHLGIGDEIEDIVGTDSDGLPLKLSDYRGKLIVLEFWGSWCGPCVAELPRLDKISRDFKDELVVIGVMNNSIDDAKKALDKHDVQWRNIVEPDGGPIQTRWNIRSWPTTYLLDANGKILRKSLRGQKLYDAIEEHLKKQKKVTLEFPRSRKRDLASSALASIVCSPVMPAC